MSDQAKKYDNLNRTLKSFAEEVEDDQKDDKDNYHLIGKPEISVNYEYGDVIATGGIKVIRRVRDCKTGRDVAMATLKPELLSVANVERFLREAQTLASLEHANIVPIYEINYDEEESLFFTMKLLSGETLASVLSNLRKGSPDYKSKYSLRKLLGIFLHTCDAIIYSHLKEVIHLDLKPENIQISEFGEVYVLDWGMAKRINDDGVQSYQSNSLHNFTPLSSNVTRSGNVSGTPGYMSPEQADNQRSTPGKASDIYSLGATLYSILYKQHPYHGASPDEILQKTSDGEDIAFPETVDGNHVPSALRAIAKKALMPEESNRYSNVEELRHDIDRYMNDFATQAEDISISRILLLFLKRHYLGAISAISVSLIIALISYFSLSTIQERDEKLNMTADEVIFGAYNKESELRFQGKFNEAIKNYEELIELGYDYPKFHYNLAYLYIGNLNLSKSLQHLKKVADQQSKLSESSEFRNTYSTVIEFHKKGLSLQSDSSAVAFADKLPENIQEHIFYSINNNPERSLEEKLLALKNNLILSNGSLPGDFHFKYKIIDGRLNLDLSGNESINNKVAITGIKIYSLDISRTGLNINSLFYYNYFLESLRELTISESTVSLNQNWLNKSKVHRLTARNTFYRAGNLKAAPNLKSLDIEGSDLMGRKWTASSMLEHLNIAHSNFQNFKLLKNFTALKSLVVDDSMNISDKLLDKLKSQGTKIIIKK